MSHEGNKPQSFTSLPLKPNGEKKHGCTTTESRLIRQSPDMCFPMEFTVVPSRTQHFGQIKETLQQVDLCLGVRGTLGLPPFIQAEPTAPAPPADNREENSPRY
jgi:hypothetical protein